MKLYIKLKVIKASSGVFLANHLASLTT